LRAHSDDINTEIGGQSDNMTTEIDMKSTLRQSREPRWEEGQTVQKSRSGSINRASHSDNINTEIDTDLLKATLRQSREPLRWVEEQTIQKLRPGSINRAYLNKFKSQEPSSNNSVGAYI
jgi:hypothetical protein